MKSLSSLIPLLAASLFAVATGELYVVSTIPELLDQSDVNAIYEAGAEIFGERRGLRTQQEERELATGYTCLNLCQGWPRGQCWVWKRECFKFELYYGSRRRTNEISAPDAAPKEQRKPNVRQLTYDEEECQNLITEVLGIMEDAVSPEAVPIVDRSQFACEEACGLTSEFALWNAHCNNKSRPSITDGTKICANDYEFSMEAFPSSCSPISVAFELTSTDNGDYSHTRTEYYPPFTVYGDKDGDVHGRNLSPGTYLLTATPDGDSDLMKSINFEVIQC